LKFSETKPRVLRIDSICATTVAGSGHSGMPQDLIEEFGIASKAIAEKVRALVA